MSQSSQRTNEKVAKNFGIFWAKSLVLLHADALDEDLVRSSLNALLKYEDDLSSVVDNLTELLNQEVKAAEAR